MPKTVIQHVLGRLKDIGIDDVFAVAGDFVFPIDDAIVQYPGIDYVGCCNELNAGYAADGYARIRGIGAVCTTYGVGELSAISAVAGSYAENVPVFHLTGMPTRAAQHKRELIHHTLGNGEFDFFAKMADPVVCARAIITAQNAAYETERLITEAFYHRRPVYMAIGTDVADQEVLGSAQPLNPPRSNPSDPVCCGQRRHRVHPAGNASEARRAAVTTAGFRRRQRHAVRDNVRRQSGAGRAAARIHRHV
jgi:indolepyruvate decarboxylase